MYLSLYLFALDLQIARNDCRSEIWSILHLLLSIFPPPSFISFKSCVRCSHWSQLVQLSGMVSLFWARSLVSPSPLNCVTLSRGPSPRDTIAQLNRYKHGCVGTPTGTPMGTPAGTQVNLTAELTEQPSKNECGGIQYRRRARSHRSYDFEKLFSNHCYVRCDICGIFKKEKCI